MKSLEKKLEEVTRRSKHPEKIRRYIVVEAIYQVQFVIYFLLIWLNLTSNHAKPQKCHIIFCRALKILLPLTKSPKTEDIFVTVQIIVHNTIYLGF
jgi:hypothetical protein